MPRPEPTASSSQEQHHISTSKPSHPSTQWRDVSQPAGQAYAIPGHSGRYLEAVDIIQRNDLAAFTALGPQRLQLSDGAGNNLVHATALCSTIPMEILRQIVHWGCLGLPNYLTGNTALHAAAQAGNWSTCKLLIGLGANTSAKNNASMTPAELAAAHGHADLSEEIAACPANGCGEGSGCAAGADQAATAPTSSPAATITPEQRSHRHPSTRTSRIRRSRSAGNVLSRRGEAEARSAEETPLLSVVTTALRNPSEVSHTSTLAKALLLALSQLKESQDREKALAQQLYMAISERGCLAEEVLRLSAASVAQEAHLREVRREVQELSSEVAFNAAVSGTSSSFREAQATIARLAADKLELAQQLQAANLRSVMYRAEAERAKRGGT